MFPADDSRVEKRGIAKLVQRGRVFRCHVLPTHVIDVSAALVAASYPALSAALLDSQPPHGG